MEGAPKHRERRIIGISSDTPKWGDQTVGEFFTSAVSGDKKNVQYADVITPYLNDWLPKFLTGGPKVDAKTVEVFQVRASTDKEAAKRVEERGVLFSGVKKIKKRGQ